MIGHGSKAKNFLFYIFIAILLAVMVILIFSSEMWRQSRIFYCQNISSCTLSDYVQLHQSDEKFLQHINKFQYWADQFFGLDNYKYLNHTNDRLQNAPLRYPELMENRQVRNHQYLQELTLFMHNVYGVNLLPKRNYKYIYSPWSQHLFHGKKDELTIRSELNLTYSNTFVFYFYNQRMLRYLRYIYPEDKEYKYIEQRNKKLTKQLTRTLQHFVQAVKSLPISLTAKQELLDLYELEKFHRSISSPI